MNDDEPDWNEEMDDEWYEEDEKLERCTVDSVSVR